jgi:hypothetical protein
MFSHKSNKRTHEEMSQQYKYIPDISFHLVFCFLTLKELSFITRCSREFRRLSTTQSFINMFFSSCEEEIQIQNSYNLHSILVSPFKNQVKHIEYYGDFASKKVLQLFTQFLKLKKIKLVYLENHVVQNQNFEKISSFNNFTMSSLQDLWVEFDLDIGFDRYIVVHFLDSLSHFPTSLKEFHMKIYPPAFKNVIVNNISNISQFQQLEILQLKIVLISSTCDTIIDTVRRLPLLRILHVDKLFHNVMNVRRLCAQPGAPPALKQISSFNGLGSTMQQNECAQLLLQLPSLERIQMKIWFPHPIPISLVQWVSDLSLEEWHFNDDFITNLSLFKKIDSIHLLNCRLVSFSSISQCTELTHLKLHRCSGLLASEFHLLYNCSKLETIQISFCDLENNLTQEQTASLKLPSQVFPALQQCKIFY